MTRVHVKNREEAKLLMKRVHQSMTGELSLSPDVVKDRARLRDFVCAVLQKTRPDCVDLYCDPENVNRIEVTAFGKSYAINTDALYREMLPNIRAYREILPNMPRARNAIGEAVVNMSARIQRMLASQFLKNPDTIFIGHHISWSGDKSLKALGVNRVHCVLPWIIDLDVFLPEGAERRTPPYDDPYALAANELLSRIESNPPVVEEYGNGSIGVGGFDGIAVTLVTCAEFMGDLRGHFGEDIFVHARHGELRIAGMSNVSAIHEIIGQHMDGSSRRYARNSPEYPSFFTFDEERGRRLADNVAIQRFGLEQSSPRRYSL